MPWLAAISLKLPLQALLLVLGLTRCDGKLTCGCEARFLTLRRRTCRIGYYRPPFLTLKRSFTQVLQRLPVIL